MEFKELQQVWDKQQEQMLFNLDKPALMNSLSQKQQGGRMMYFSELMLVLVAIYLVAAILTLTVSIPGAGRGIFRYVLAGWLLASALYVIIRLAYRMQARKHYDYSMLENLDNAIVTAGYQVLLSRFLRWNILPVCALSLLWLWHSGQHIAIIAISLLLFTVTYISGNREYRFYQARKQEWENLRQQLKSER